MILYVENGEKGGWLMPTLKDLAQECGLSQSTLSRALNYCSGTGADAARIACELKRKYDIRPFDRGEYRVGVILPDTPKYFWHLAWTSLRDRLKIHGIRFRPAFFESMRCGALVVEILREMEELGIELVVMPYVADCADYIAESSMRYFFLCEHAELENTFSFCSDSYRDGVRLGQLITDHLPDQRKIVMVRGKNETANPRLRGLRDVVGGDRICADMMQPLVNLHLVPALLARELAALNVEFDTVCCLSGFSHRAALAIHKLGLLGKVKVVGFEGPGPDNPYVRDGTIAALMVQDITKQAQIVADAVADYTRDGKLPEQQYTTIDSIPRLFRPEDGECDQ